jgi:hypothetical protein
MQTAAKVTRSLSDKEVSLPIQLGKRFVAHVVQCKNQPTLQPASGPVRLIQLFP